MRELPIDSLPVVVQSPSCATGLDHHKPDVHIQHSLRRAPESRALARSEQPGVMGGARISAWPGILTLFRTLGLTPWSAPEERQSARSHLEPGCQHAWEALAITYFFDKDIQALPQCGGPSRQQLNGRDDTGPARVDGASPGATRGTEFAPCR